MVPSISSLPSISSYPSITSQPSEFDFTDPANCNYTLEYSKPKCGFSAVIEIDQVPPLFVDDDCTTRIGLPEDINLTIIGIADITANNTNATCRWLDENGDLVATVDCTPGEKIEVEQGNVSHLFSPPISAHHHLSINNLTSLLFQYTFVADIDQAGVNTTCEPSIELIANTCPGFAAGCAVIENMTTEGCNASGK